MNFVGMLTDSRSHGFLYPPRLFSPHSVQYDRRLGGAGRSSDNNDILTRMIKNICHDNAKNYFKF